MDPALHNYHSPAISVAFDTDPKKKNRLAQRKSRSKKQAANAAAAESNHHVGAATANSALPARANGAAVDRSNDGGHLDVTWPAANNHVPLMHVTMPSRSGPPSHGLESQDESSSSEYPSNYAEDPLTAGTSLNFSDDDADIALSADFQALYQELQDPGSISGSLMQEPTLHRAVRKKNSGIVALLLHHGAPIDALCARGLTALHLAIRQDDEHIVRLLLENQADVTLRDSDGLTALDLAIELERMDAVQLLLAHGTPV